eukprot:6880451-Pyramimonas_sp.AAC.1
MLRIECDVLPSSLLLHLHLFLLLLFLLLLTSCRAGWRFMARAHFSVHRRMVHRIGPLGSRTASLPGASWTQMKGVRVMRADSGGLVDASGY